MAKMVDDAYQMMQDMGKNDDLSDEEVREIARKVGLGALKYFILKVDARKNMLFNPAESIDFNGNTGPFIQYTYARIASVLRKAKEAGISMQPASADGLSLEEKEINLIQRLRQFEPVLRQAGTDYSPSGIANYCYDLTKEYNQFYHDHSILHETDQQKQQFRLLLSQTVAKTLRNAMGLLGIEMPERM